MSDYEDDYVIEYANEYVGYYKEFDKVYQPLNKVYKNNKKKHYEYGKLVDCIQGKKVKYGLLLIICFCFLAFILKEYRLQSEFILKLEEIGPYYFLFATSILIICILYCLLRMTYKIELYRKGMVVKRGVFKKEIPYEAIKNIHFQDKRSQGSSWNTRVRRGALESWIMYRLFSKYTECIILIKDEKVIKINSRTHSKAVAKLKNLIQNIVNEVIEE